MPTRVRKEKGKGGPKHERKQRAAHLAMWLFFFFWQCVISAAKSSDTEEENMRCEIKRQCYCVRLTDCSDQNAF
jgi:hypothetical protein